MGRLVRTEAPPLGRASVAIVAASVTRAGVSRAVQGVAGMAPVIVEPANATSDCAVARRSPGGQARPPGRVSREREGGERDGPGRDERRVPGRVRVNAVDGVGAAGRAAPLGGGGGGPPTSKTVATSTRPEGVVAPAITAWPEGSALRSAAERVSVLPEMADIVAPGSPDATALRPVGPR